MIICLFHLSEAYHRMTSAGFDFSIGTRQWVCVYDKFIPVQFGLQRPHRLALPELKRDWYEKNKEEQMI